MYDEPKILMQLYGPPLHDTSVCKLASPQYPVSWKITFGDMKVKAVTDMSKELSGILNRSVSSLYCVWWPSRRGRIGVGGATRLEGGELLTVLEFVLRDTKIKSSVEHYMHK